MSSSGREAKDTRKRGGVTKPVKAPGGSISFTKYIYILAALSFAASVYYAYRMSEVERAKAANFQENLNRARGKPPSGTTNRNTAAEDVQVSVQQKIEELADMLGIKPVVLASAVANVLKPPHIPAESASSLVSEAKKAKNTESVMSALKEGMENSDASPTAEPTETTTTGGVAASVISMVKQAGFDDMGIELD